MSSIYQPNDDLPNDYQIRRMSGAFNKTKSEPCCFECYANNLMRIKLETVGRSWTKEGFSQWWDAQWGPCFYAYPDDLGEFNSA